MGCQPFEEVLMDFSSFKKEFIRYNEQKLADYKPISVCEILIYVVQKNILTFG